MKIKVAVLDHDIEFMDRLEKIFLVEKQNDL